MTNSKILLLLPSFAEFKSTPIETIHSAYVVAWQDKEGEIFVEKNCITGEKGFYNSKQWATLVDSTANVINASDDLLSMTQYQLIDEVVKLREENERLRKENIEMSWRENPDRMGGQFTREEIERNWDRWS